MEYCLGDADGSATMWTAAPDVDVDGLLDDAMTDTDGDGLADHAVLDFASDATFFTDDGTGTWAVAVDRAGQVRWFGLDGVEHTGGPVVDVDADGQTDDRLTDTDGNGLADRAVSGDIAYVDTDGDGRWDVKLADADGDGKADAATGL
jgi:hypothetical protein